jgi:hypothetical protein
MARYRESRKGMGGRPKIADGEDTVLLQIKISKMLKLRLAEVTDNVSAFVRDLIERAVEREEKRKKP